MEGAPNVTLISVSTASETRSQAVEVEHRLPVVGVGLPVAPRPESPPLPPALRAGRRLLGRAAMLSRHVRATTIWESCDATAGAAVQ